MEEQGFLIFSVVENMQASCLKKGKVQMETDFIDWMEWNLIYLNERKMLYEFQWG